MEIRQSMANHGAERLILLNCHGGNRVPLKLAADRFQRDHGLKTFFVHWTDFARDQLEKRFGDEWGHAGDHETSAIELFYPDLVKTERKDPQNRRAEFEARQYSYFDDITEQGGLGDPTESDSEFMKAVVDDTNKEILESLQSDVGYE